METAIVKPDTQKIESSLLAIRSRAEAIQVTDADTYTVACEVVKEARQYIKNVGFELDPGIEAARATLDLLRNQKNRFVDPAKQIAEVAAQKAESWKATERRKAEEEQRRINEERRIAAAQIAETERKERERLADIERKKREKEIEEQRKAGELGKREAARLSKAAAEEAEREKARAAADALEAAANVQEVQVKAAVPTVAGIKARVNYKFEVTDQNKVQVRFLKPDEVLIGQKVRADKDPERSMREIGGIRAWAEDGV